MYATLPKRRGPAAPGLLLCVAACAAFLSKPARADPQEIHPTYRIFETGEDLDETYHLNTFGIVHEELFSPSPFTVVFGGVWWRPVRGKYRQSLAYRDFYEALGRPDLADAQAEQHLVSELLVWGGLAMEIGGVVLFFTGLGGRGLSTSSEVGIGLFAGGLVAGAVGSSTDKPAISEEEALAMSTTYNEALRGHLAESGSKQTRWWGTSTKSRLTLAPAFGPGHAGLSLRVVF